MSTYEDKNIRYQDEVITIIGRHPEERNALFFQEEKQKSLLEIPSKILGKFNRFPVVAETYIRLCMSGVPVEDCVNRWEGIIRDAAENHRVLALKNVDTLFRSSGKFPEDAKTLAENLATNGCIFPEKLGK